MTPSTQRLLVFDVQGSRYALTLEEVAEVLDPLPTFPIPRAPLYFHGAINFHGRIVSVLDLAAYLRLGTSLPEGKTVVLDHNLANLALKVGLHVNIVSTDIVLEEEAGSSPLVGKVLIMADGEVQLLDVAQLLQELEGAFAA